jgi:hypothetical protein
MTERMGDGQAISIPCPRSGPATFRPYPAIWRFTDPGEATIYQPVEVLGAPSMDFVRVHYRARWMSAWTVVPVRELVGVDYE